MDLTRRRPLVFPTLGVSANLKLTANLQTQISNAPPFPSHRSRAAGDTDPRGGNTLGAEAAGRQRHGRLQIWQGNSGQKKDASSSVSQEGHPLPVPPRQAGRGDPSSPRALHSTHRKRAGTSTDQPLLGCPVGQGGCPCCIPWDGERGPRGTAAASSSSSEMLGCCCPLEPARKNRNKHHHGKLFCFS